MQNCEIGRFPSPPLPQNHGDHEKAQKWPLNRGGGKEAANRIRRGEGSKNKLEAEPLM